MLKTLSSFQHSKDGGLLITSCYIHCQTWMTSTWHSSNSPRINNKVEVFINHLPNLHFWILIWLELRWCCPHWNCCSILLSGKHDMRVFACTLEFIVHLWFTGIMRSAHIWYLKCCLNKDLNKGNSVWFKVLITILDTQCYLNKDLEQWGSYWFYPGLFCYQSSVILGSLYSVFFSNKLYW